MSTATMPAESTWLRANVASNPVGVDREAGEAGVIFGYIVAEEGPFESEGRGEFNAKALKGIVKLMKANGPVGTRSRFTHPDLSGDGLGKHLGRARNPRLDVVNRKGVDVQVVRADLHLDVTAVDEPVGGGKPLGTYIMDLAESDPGAVESSLALHKDEELRLDRAGRPLRGEDGEVLPPLWLPTAILASDIVSEGDATHGGLLSADSLPDAIVRKASELLDTQFSGCSREVVEARCMAYLGRYLSRRYGEPPEEDYKEPPPETIATAAATTATVGVLVSPPLHPKKLRMVKRPRE